MKTVRIISYLCMAVGIVLFLAGIVYKIQHWPDIFKCMISGGIVMFVGALLFIVSLVKKQ